MNASAKVTSSAPPEAASSMILHVLSTDLRRSSHSGSYWATATRVVGLDMIEKSVLIDKVDKDVSVTLEIPGFITSLGN